MFKDILTPELEAKAKLNVANIDGYKSDCEELIAQTLEDIITTEKINEFRRRYSHIRGYHACRPIDDQSYYQNGLKPLCKEEQTKHFRNIFLNGDFPEITEEMLQESIKKVKEKDNDLCLVLDDRDIIEFSGHYLIYGSEYLTNLVTQLPIENSQEKYFPVLRKIGKPTIFKINLPNTTEYVSDYRILEVIESMITEWVYCLAHLKTENHIYPNDGLSFLKPILPEHICSDYSPKKIKDPILEVGEIYDTETGRYIGQDGES